MKKYSVNRFLFLFFILYSSSGHLLASNQITADEVRTMFMGHTVEGERRAYENTAMNKLINFAEQFVSYYAEDGAIKQQIGGAIKTGKWRVTENGDLCITWEDKDEDCAPVYKRGDVYQRVVKNNKGRLKFEIKYLQFVSGNVNNL